MNEDGDLDDGAGRRHRLWMVLWTAVGALATAVTAVITFWQLNTSEEQPPRSGGASKPGKSFDKDDKHSSLPDAKISLKNTYTHFCADIPGTGAGKPTDFVQQSNCVDEGDNQLWLLKPYPGAEGPNGRPAFKIFNVASGLCMDLPRSDKRPEKTPVGMHKCTQNASKDNQAWWRQKVEGGYWIRNLASNGLCLDVAGLEVEKPDVPLLIYSCVPGDDQAWQMREIT